MNRLHLSTACAMAAILVAGTCAAQAFDAERSRDLVARLGAPQGSVAAGARDELLAARDGALPVLALAMKEGSHLARGQAVLFFALIERERLASGNDPRYLDELVGALADPAESVRRAAVHGLVYLGEFGLAPLAQAFARPGAPPRRYLEEVEDTVFSARVERALVDVISPDGGYGTYPGAFKAVADLGPAATAICIDIFQNPNRKFVLPVVRDSPITQLKVQFLAGSALYEIAGDEIVPELRLLYDQAETTAGDLATIADTQSTSATILSLHGESSRFDMELQKLGGSGGGAGLGSSVGSTARPAEVANMYLKSNRNRSSLSWYERAAGDWSSMNSNINVYNIACAYSRMREKRRALEALKRAVEELNYSGLDWIQKDGDLDYIRDDPEFERIVNVIRTGHDTEDLPLRQR